MPYKQSESQKMVVEDVMSKFKHGKLKSGSGEKVKDKEQAKAIAMSEAGESKDLSPAQNKRNLDRAMKKKLDKEKSYH